MPADTAARASQRDERLSPLLFGILFALEISAFFVHIASDVAPFYPPGYDQAEYLTRAYNLAIAVRSEGIERLLDPFFGPFQANGFLFPVEGALGGMLIGSPRAGALSVNLVAFLGLQVVAFLTFRRIVGRSIAWVAVALILTMQSPFVGAGGIYDFRIDFVALCLFGVWCCAVLRSDIFLDAKWSMVSSIIGIILVCNRFITFVYLGTILALFFILSIILAFTTIDSEKRARWLRRVKNMLVAGTLLLIGTIPFLFINRRLIYGYYAQSMFVGSDGEIRAAEYHIETLADHLLFYPRSLFLDHLGAPLLRSLVVLTIIALAWAIAVRGRRPRVIWEDLRRWSVHLVFLCITIALPLVLLNASHDKSPVVGGVLCVPFLCLALILIAALLGPPKASRFGRASWVPAIIINGAWTALVLAVAAGTALFLTRASATTSSWSVYDREALNNLYDRVVTYEVAAGTKAPIFSSDRVGDWLWSNDLPIRSYERFNDMIDFQPGLGQSIWGVERDEALKILASSDVIVLTAGKGSRQLVYPMDAKIESYWQDLWDWTVANRVQLAADTINGIPHTVFVKPMIRISGASGSWITSKGATLTIRGRDLDRWPFVILGGAALYDALGAVPRVSATVDLASAPSTVVALPAELTRIGDTYRISIDARSLKNLSTDEVNIRLTFDRFFVPVKIGMNSDTRELVVMEPTQRELRQ